MACNLFHAYVLLSLFGIISCLRSIPSSEISVELVDGTLDECQTAVDEICYDNNNQKRICVNRCKRDCLRTELKSLERYDWVNRKLPARGRLWSSYASIRRCVTKNLTSAGSYGLYMGTPPYDNLDCRINTGSMYIINQFYFPHGDPIRYKNYNGTISFRMKLSTKNLIQTRRRCARLTVYVYSEPHDLKLYLNCTRSGDNMDLYIGYMNKRENDRIIVNSVLNDDKELTVENSVHFAHTIDTVNKFSILYINGKPVYSMTAEGRSRYLSQIYNSQGLNSVLYDFYVYDDVLNEQQVRSVYQKSTFSVEREPECTCPPTHPILVRDDDEAVGQAVKCAAPVDYVPANGDISAKISRAQQIDRTKSPQTRYPITNILEQDSKWISAETDEAEILILFSDRDQVVGVVLDIETLPEHLEIRTADHELISITNTTCDPEILTCNRWNDERVNLVGSRLNLSFDQIPLNRLLTDRLYIKLNRHYDGRQHPFVISSVDVKYSERLASQILRL